MLWNKILSDNDGHYLELMVGGYSDNQPDYSWLAPGEIREFKQTWFPIKGIKGIKNASEKHKLMPIPQRVINESNGIIEQNPGY